MCELALRFRDPRGDSQTFRFIKNANGWDFNWKMNSGLCSPEGAYLDDSTRNRIWMSLNHHGFDNKEEFCEEIGNIWKQLDDETLSYQEAQNKLNRFNLIY